MKRFVLAIVLLGSAAGAQPKKQENAERLRYGDEHAAPRQDPDAPCSGCVVELASPTPAAHGTEHILVGKERGAFAKVRVDARHGRVVVHKVRVEFADGHDKRFVVDKVIDGKRMVTIDLGAAREIDSIAITTERGAGSYVVQGIYGSSPGAGG